MKEPARWFQYIVGVAIVIGSGATAVMAYQGVAGDGFVTRPRVVTATGEVTAIIPGTNFPNNDWWVSLKKYDAPQLPDEAAEYDITDDVPCLRGYIPTTATAVPHTGWPDNDVMYTVNTQIKDERVILSLRSKRVHYWTNHPYERGYAYINVLVQCVLR